MPRRRVTRPASGLCSCGETFAIAAKGPVSTRCPSCQSADRFGLAVAILSALPPAFRSSARGRDAAILRGVADRLEPVDPVLVIDEILDRLDLARMTPETATRIARRLDAASKRVLRRAGLLRRKGIA